MSLRYVISPSGGLVYHFIARRRSRSTWRPFQAVVREWLASWLTPADRELIVFGPSAGWTLPLDAFKRFSHLTFVEPDPVARFLLRRRLASAGVDLKNVDVIGRSDLLPWFSKEPSTLEDFLAERPNAAILFANVLGQVPLHLSKSHKANVVSAQKLFADSLRGRRWASYHDLFSGTAKESQGLRTDRLSSGIEKLPGQIFTVGDVTDHETCWLSQGRETKLGLWPITEDSIHVIGFIQEPTK
jgi:hypothetical protein